MSDERKVCVKDLLEYLSTLPPDTEIHLDKDGWEFQFYADVPAPKMFEARGLFHTYDGCLFINN